MSSYKVMIEYTYHEIFQLKPLPEAWKNSIIAIF